MKMRNRVETGFNRFYRYHQALGVIGEECEWVYVPKPPVSPAKSRLYSSASHVLARRAVLSGSIAVNSSKYGRR